MLLGGGSLNSTKEEFYIEVFAYRLESRRDYIYAYVSYSDSCISFIEESDYPKMVEFSVLMEVSIKPTKWTKHEGTLNNPVSIEKLLQ